MKKILFISALLFSFNGWTDSTYLACSDVGHNSKKGFSINELLEDKIDFSEVKERKLRKKFMGNAGSSNWPTPIANKLNFAIFEIKKLGEICLTYLNDNDEIRPVCSSWEVNDDEYRTVFCDNNSTRERQCSGGPLGPWKISRSIDRKTLIYKEQIGKYISLSTGLKWLSDTNWSKKFSCQISDKNTVSLMESKFYIARKPFIDYMNSYLDKQRKKKQKELDKNKI